MDQRVHHVPASDALERRFYARTRAFGRFGMRIFEPVVMAKPHWHGHIEVNLVRDARMHYIVDGEKVAVEANTAVVFWAGVPHQLVAVEQSGSGVPELGNIYLPLDSFLYMPHIPNLQVALLTGGMIAVPPEHLNWDLLGRWYADYRSGDPLRIDLIKWDLNGIFWRQAMGQLNYVRKSWQDRRDATALTSVHVRHVVAMVRHALDNLQKPLQNADVTAVTGLHANYALALFTKIMQLPLKQFIIRMRLLRARGLLLESDMAITGIAEESGFSSMSQFYAHFAAAYGTSPQQLRDRYMTDKPGFAR